jgi:hypothetical protein
MSTLVAQNISNGTVSTSSLNVIRGSARAWVQFTGSTGAVLSAFNISSITRNGAGDYTFNFTTAMPTVNYCFVALGTAGGSNYQIAGGGQGNGTTLTTTSLRTQYGYVSSISGALANQDPAIGYLAIFSA